MRAPFNNEGGLEAISRASYRFLMTRDFCSKGKEWTSPLHGLTGKAWRGSWVRVRDEVSLLGVWKDTQECANRQGRPGERQGGGLKTSCALAFAGDWLSLQGRSPVNPEVAGCSARSLLPCPGWLAGRFPRPGEEQ